MTKPDPVCFVFLLGEKEVFLVSDNLHSSEPAEHENRGSDISYYPVASWLLPAVSLLLPDTDRLVGREAWCSKQWLPPQTMFSGLSYPPLEQECGKEWEIKPVQCAQSKAVGVFVTSPVCLSNRLLLLKKPRRRARGFWRNSTCSMCSGQTAPLLPTGNAAIWAAIVKIASKVKKLNGWLFFSVGYMLQSRTLFPPPKYDFLEKTKLVSFKVLLWLWWGD